MVSGETGRHLTLNMFSLDRRFFVVSAFGINDGDGGGCFMGHYFRLEIFKLNQHKCFMRL